MTPGHTIYRVQGRDGRGPYAPGFSRKWCDAEGPIPPPTCHEAFQDLDASIRARRMALGGFVGCAVRSPLDIGRWFTATERRRLLELRFNLVRLRADEIIAENADQVVFWRRRPLREGAAVVPWPVPDATTAEPQEPDDRGDGQPDHPANPKPPPEENAGH